MISIKRSGSRISAAGQRQSSSATRTLTKCGKCCYYFRQVITFLFSHIGLGTLLLGYALVGAFTFQALESKHEQQQRIEMLNIREQTILNISKMTNESLILRFDFWTDEAENILKNFEKEFLNAVKNKGYDGSEELSKTSLQWSFSGSLLYSIIVITTIGYGNVAPRTDWGKIVTILYAIIGIPLMLFCLSNIGHTMANSFKFIYWKCCCYLCVKPKKIQRQRRRRMRRKIRKYRRNQQRDQILKQLQPITCNHLSTATILPFAGRPLSRSASNRSAKINMDNGNRLLNPDYLSPISMTPSTPISSKCSDSSLFIPPSIETNNIHNRLQLPTNYQPKLARSLSARYYNETKSKPSVIKHSLSSASKNHPSTSGSNQKSRIVPVIFNKYASCSDECIDRSKSERELQLKTNQVRFGPSKNSSLIPFQPQAIPNTGPTIRVPTCSKSINEPSPSLYQQTSSTLEMSFDHMTSLNMDASLQSFQPNDDNDFSELSDIPDTDTDDDNSNIQEKNIPIAVCLALVISYICGGAWFFSTSEDWSFLDASYFCFITLSTIGFGDLVPGRTVLSTPEDGQMTLAICALYLLFGMALLAMSLNLVKEKVLEAVRIIGERIGILVNDEDNYDY